MVWYHTYGMVVTCHTIFRKLEIFRDCGISTEFNAFTERSCTRTHPQRCTLSLLMVLNSQSVLHYGILLGLLIIATLTPLYRSQRRKPKTPTKAKGGRLLCIGNLSTVRSNEPADNP